MGAYWHVQFNLPGDIVTALLREGGLQLEFLHEHNVLDWQITGTVVKDEEIEGAGFGDYRWPQHQRDLCPTMFSIRATKPCLYSTTDERHRIALTTWN